MPSLSLALYRLGTQNLGNAEWSQWRSLAKKSSIPHQFSAVVTDNAYEELASKVFGNIFSTSDERTYAIVYCHAIASIKTYHIFARTHKTALSKYKAEMEKMAYLQKNMERVCAFYGCNFDELPAILLEKGFPQEDIPDVALLREVPKELSSVKVQLDSGKSYLKTLEDSTKVLCGCVLCLESFGVPPRSLKHRILWYIRRSRGKTATQEELLRVRGIVEKHFESQKNVNRVLLLAQKKK